METSVKNEQFREYCYMGDLDLVTNFYRTEMPDVNSQNKINGWTVLHWAAKKNHLKVVEFLLGAGADYQIRNNAGKLPAELTSEDSIRKALKFEASPQPKEENQAANKFIPNFVKNPEFHYANKTIYNTNTKPAKENDEETFATPDENIKTYLSPQSEPMLTDTQFMQNTILESRLPGVTESPMINGIPNEEDIITIKVRAHNNEDFVELDIDRNMSFEKFKKQCISELDSVDTNSPLLKIRKLPNVLIRDSRDLKRLKQDQEIVFIFKMSGH